MLENLILCDEKVREEVGKKIFLVLSFYESNYEINTKKAVDLASQIHALYTAREQAKYKVWEEATLKAEKAQKEHYESELAQARAEATREILDEIKLLGETKISQLLAQLEVKG